MVYPTLKNTFLITDLRKLQLDPDYSPESLQNKVQWDLRFYFARRANENIDQFTKGTFKLNRHAATNLKYITKCYDEQTKNHQSDETDVISACMMEIPGSKYCPVSSFQKYLSHLSPFIQDLWQYPKDRDVMAQSEVWYYNKKIGSNPLSAFMSTMSHDAELSRSYTNHSIRVTATTYLGREDFSSKQIMAITGHRSLNSLSIYQKVSTDKKLKMAYAMSSYLMMDIPTKQIVPMEGQQQEMPQLPSTSYETAPPSNATVTTTLQEISTNPQENNQQIVPYESEDPFSDTDLGDIDLANIIETIEKENTTAMTQSATGGNLTTNIMKHHTVQKRSPQIPMFNNCKIGNINITINKN